MRGVEMKIKKNIGRLLITSCLFGTGTLLAQEPAGAAPDNTTVNQRDRNANEPTADRQKENRTDRDVTQQIRKSITNDKSLSSYAHNVKVVTQNGQVTLKGPVRSEEEKRAVEAKATEIAGENKITSELEVKPKN
jgi:osmotically-inducible protein OsmY